MEGSSGLKECMIDYIFGKLRDTGVNCRFVNEKRKCIEISGEEPIISSTFTSIGDRTLYLNPKAVGEKYTIEAAVNRDANQKILARHTLEKNAKLIVYINGFDHQTLSNCTNPCVMAIIWINILKDPTLMPKSTFRIVKGMKKKFDSIQSELGRMGGRFADLDERIEGMEARLEAGLKAGLEAGLKAGLEAGLEARFSALEERIMDRIVSSLGQPLPK